MANSFSKEEKVAFDLVLEGFNDQLVLSRATKIFRNDQTMMARTNDIIWRPQPYIALVYNGLDQTGNFKDQTQLSVPARLNQYKSSPFQLTALELRDQLQEKRLGEAAKQILASSINQFATDLACQQGTLVVKRTAAASGFDDLAQADSIMNEQGITSSTGRRMAAFSSRDYNSMASNLAGRQTMNEKPVTAYERALINSNISGFDVLKLDYTRRLVSAKGVGVTVTGANQFYTPVATTTDINGGGINVDNRYQTVNLTVTSGAVKAGDAFTIAGVFAVHHITKEDTGQLKTFRVMSVPGGGGTGAYVISPPIISGQGGTVAELQYKNVTATPAAGAAVTWLNTTDAAINPFWSESAIELLPGRVEFPQDAGMEVMRASTDQGFEIVMVKQGSIDSGNIKYRFDTFFGGVMNNPEMCGFTIFNQA